MIHNDELKQDDKKISKNNRVLIIIMVLIISILVLLFYLFVSKTEERIDNNDFEVESEFDTENEEETIPIIMKPEYRVSDNSLDDFDLFFLQTEDEKVNKVYSPLSIKYALSMLKEGVKENSKVQIDDVIENYTIKKYTNSSNMSFANAFFIRDSYKDNIESSYIDVLKNNFNAEVIYDSFESANNLNSWVKNKTFNLIDNLYDRVNDDFVLINALAIDMEWVNNIQSTKDFYSVKYPNEKFSISIEPLEFGYNSINFDNSSRKVRTVEIGAAINKYDIVSIIGEDNIRKTVGEEYKKYLAEDRCGSAASEPSVDEYLNQYIKDIDSNYKKINSSTDFQFYDDENVKVFAKNLKEYDGVTLQYVGIMPKNHSLDNYIKNIDSTKVSTIINNLMDVKIENFEEGVITEIKGSIPTFNFEYQLNLETDLKALGITDIFSSKDANISGITSIKNSYISSSIHKSNIEFSNNGIKAAAATSMGGLGSSGGCSFSYIYDVPVKTIDLTFDNPYLFLIRDKNSGEVWFVGTVYDPIKF